MPVVAIGLNWKRATATAANVAIISSLVANFTIMFLKSQKIFLPHGIDGGAVASLTSLVLFFNVSFAAKPQQRAPDVEAVLDA